MAGTAGTKFYPILSVICIVFTLILSLKLQIIPRNFFKPIRFLSYFFWLIKEIISSSWSLTRIIWSPIMNISPRFIKLKTGINASDPALVIYANSITLTPGTYTANINRDMLTVHAISKNCAEDLNSGTMKNQVLHYFSN